MKWIWFAAVVNAVAFASGVELLEAAATTCTTAAQCPAVACYTTDCVTGKCQYSKKATGAKCPGQSCSNGGVCDDDANDFCNDKGECQDGFKPSTAKCPGKSCSNGGTCDDDANDYCDGSGKCVSAFYSSTKVCRPSAGQCDVAETCSGSSGSCPIDGYHPVTMKCSGVSSGGACDGQDLCDGFGNCVDVYLPSTAVCRAAKGVCDLEEKCSGSSGLCPTDLFASSTTSCTGVSNGGGCDGQDLCDGKGNCVDKYMPSSTVCRASNGQCDVEEKCSGSSGQCPADAFQPATMRCTGLSTGGACDGQDLCDGKGNCVDVYLPSTTVCRATLGQCDIEEKCTGTSGQCPVDVVQPSTMSCTGACNGRPCDGQDYCDGRGRCVDVYLPATTVCRPSTGQCDVEEKCTGTSSFCPADSFAPSTKQCSGGSNGGGCDGQDMCDGKGNCVDVYMPSSTVCRPAKGPCDVAESCLGTSGQCPVDVFQPATMKCTGGSNGGACDIQDMCDGKGNCVDLYLPSTSVCRASKGQCDVEEKCSGSSGQCPTDAFAPTTTTCKGTSIDGACDDVDKCDGKGNCVDAYKPSSTVCRQSKGPCDVTEYCSGTAGACPVDGFAPATSTCSGTSSNGLCDGQDLCDGKGACVDKYLSSSTVCRPSTGQCDVEEKCSGTSGVCPTNAYAPATTKCTGTCNGNPCDGQDLCDGNGVCVDKYLPKGSVCGNAKAGPCTIAAVCTGDMGFCPPDEYADSSVTCTGKSSGNVCDGVDKCDGNGACADKFLNNVVCQKPVGYARPTYCNGKQATCPVASFLEAPHLRDMLASDSVAASEQLLVLRSSSPLVLVGLVCAVAAAVALVALRSPRATTHNSYTELNM